MLKSFIVSFVFTLSIILYFGQSNKQDNKISSRIEKEISKEEIFELKNSSTCNNINAIADIMFGEGENQTLDAKYALAKFLISESIKNDRTLCQELTYKMSGGALKYSSMHKNLNKLKKKRAKSYEKIREEAKQFWNNKEYLNYKDMEKFNHYITLKLAKNNPPKWFKYYIVEYKLYGDHIFVNLDFKHKSKRYIENYKKIARL